MELKIDTWYKNKGTGSYHIFHDVITEDDIAEIIKEIYKDNLPMWMDENWEFDNIVIENINL